ncbi:MAG: redoxin domain-containing protein, partial [Planctomycetota bacterium]
MKRYIVSIIIVAVVLAVALVSFGQSEGERPERRRGEGRRRWIGRDEQLEAISTIEGELSKIKKGLESLPGSREEWQDLSDEEREELREKFRDMRDERQEALSVIEEQIPKLKGPRRLGEAHEEAIGKLKAIHELAVKEEAKETAESIQELIDKRQKEFEDKMEKLGLQSERGRRSREQAGQVRAGRKAPVFELKSFDGETVSLSDYEGKIVVLEWLNYECPFVKYHYEQAKTMIKLAEKYKDKNVIWL